MIVTVAVMLRRDGSGPCRRLRLLSSMQHRSCLGSLLLLPLPFLLFCLLPSGCHRSGRRYGAPQLDPGLLRPGRQQHHRRLGDGLVGHCRRCSCFCCAGLLGACCFYCGPRANRPLGNPALRLDPAPAVGSSVAVAIAILRCSRGRGRGCWRAQVDRGPVEAEGSRGACR